MYEFTLPARADANLTRAVENVHVRLKLLNISISEKTISIEIFRTDTDTHDSSIMLFIITEPKFTDIMEITPSGATFKEFLQAGMWNYLITNHKAEISFNGDAPLDETDIDGTVFEEPPVWTEV